MKDAIESQILKTLSASAAALAPMKKLVAKGGKKKHVLKFTLNCTHTAEDRIMGTANFEQLLQERIERKSWESSWSIVTVKKSKTKIIVASEVSFSKRYLKYFTKKKKLKNSLHDWLHVVTNSIVMNRYFQINQDEKEEGDED
ncbi:60S ribosomal protein L22-like isoform X1 [Sciurus carolinensis]|uniref:60S ribosomal protein L22-like isoform X1 n=1 Tax=Sciurus carolinensis TaxID=30640 RepID=UPI001FB539E5|nr:60S ribosomal protein L22-like isoform X1 [Sciurus carolinensis]